MGFVHVGLQGLFYFIISHYVVDEFILTLFKIPSPWVPQNEIFFNCFLNQKIKRFSENHIIWHAVVIQKGALRLRLTGSTTQPMSWMFCRVKKLSVPIIFVCGCFAVSFHNVTGWSRSCDNASVLQWAFVFASFYLINSFFDHYPCSKIFKLYVFLK